MNKAIICGNLGADPEVRTTNSGTSVANLRVATNERRKVGGEWTDHTEWHRVVAFGKTAENCGKYLTKGRKVLIEGRISTSQYTDKNGVEKYSTEIVADRVDFLSGGESAQGGGNRGGQQGGGYDDVPF